MCKAEPTETSPKQPLAEPTLVAVATRFRLLGAPSRLRVLNALMAGPRSMAALVAETGLTQSNLSRQVVALEQGLCVRRSRHGREVVVEISDPTLRELCELVCGALTTQTEARLAALRAS